MSFFSDASSPSALAATPTPSMASSFDMAKSSSPSSPSSTSSSRGLLVLYGSGIGPLPKALHMFAKRPLAFLSSSFWQACACFNKALASLFCGSNSTTFLQPSMHSWK